MIAVVKLRWFFFLVVALAQVHVATAAEVPLPSAPSPPANSPPAPVAPPASIVPPAPSWRDRFQLDGLLDVAYATQLGGAGVQTLEPRAFDDVGNTFMLTYAKVGLGVEAAPVGARVDLGFGHAADVTASDQDRLDAEGLRHVQQAYLTFVVPARVPVTIDVGKFVAGVGGEVIETNRNWNTSRSLLFARALPFSLAGLRVGVDVLPRLTLRAMLVNGWDRVFDNNGDKTFGLSMAFAAPSGTTLTLNGLAGVEVVGAAPPWRLLLDLVVSQRLGRADLMLDATLAREGAARWYGVAAYGRLAVATHFTLALRGEVFADPDGARLIPNTSARLEELTLTAGVPLGHNAELRAEARADFADQPFFMVDAEVTDHQLELLAAALAWF